MARKLLKISVSNSCHDCAWSGRLKQKFQNMADTFSKSHFFVFFFLYIISCKNEIKKKFKNPLRQDLELCLWIVQEIFQTNWFNLLCSILATDLENMVLRKTPLKFWNAIKLGSHELTFNLQYQDRRVRLPDRRIIQKRNWFSKCSHWLTPLR